MRHGPWKRAWGRTRTVQKTCLGAENIWPRRSAASENRQRIGSTAPIEGEKGSRPIIQDVTAPSHRPEKELGQSGWGTCHNRLSEMTLRTRMACFCGVVQKRPFSGDSLRGISGVAAEAAEKAPGSRDRLLVSCEALVSQHREPVGMVMPQQLSRALADAFGAPAPPVGMVVQEKTQQVQVRGAQLPTQRKVVPQGEIKGDANI